jgi:gamma-glutamyltranspeptidase
LRCIARARFDQVIARIDERVKALVEANPDRQQHATHMRTIDGVGAVVSATPAKNGPVWR